jgi:hypothetical protein
MTKPKYYIPNRDDAVVIAQEELKKISQLYRDGWDRVEYSANNSWNGPKALALEENVLGTFVISYLPRQNSVALMAGNTGLKPVNGPGYETEVLVSFHSGVNSLSKKEMINKLIAELAEQQKTLWEELQRITDMGETWK